MLRVGAETLNLGPEVDAAAEGSEVVAAADDSSEDEEVSVDVWPKVGAAGCEALPEDPDADVAVTVADDDMSALLTTDESAVRLEVSCA